MNYGRKRPKILLTRKLTDEAEKEFAVAFDCTFNLLDTPMTARQLTEAAAGHDGIALTSLDKFPADVVNALPAGIRILATVSAGFEHIDLQAACGRQITVTNTPGVLTDATADIAMLLLLGAARGASWGDRMVREDRWPAASLVSPLGHDVSGKRLGILGMGRIGQAVARRARPFGMEVHYHNRKPVSEQTKMDTVYHAKLEDLLPNCDFLSINCALTPATKGLINANALALMPRGAIVVNTARGGIIVDDDLIAALRTGQLSAAGLDVFANEPAIDPRYRTLENVFMLPHLGSATPRTRTNMGLRALANLKAFFDGSKPADALT